MLKLQPGYKSCRVKNKRFRVVAFVFNDKPDLFSKKDANSGY